jgi:hypothetical protein
VRSFYASSDEYVAGESVVTNKPVLVDGGKTQVLHHSDSLLQITNIKPDVDLDTDGFMVELNHGTIQFMPADWTDAKNLMKLYAKNKEWKKYFYIKDHWLDLRPVHASTVHKAQGSTYKHVFIDLNDISRNNKWREVTRLMYVAITRASDEVNFYGELRDRYK